MTAQRLRQCVTRVLRRAVPAVVLLSLLYGTGLAEGVARSGPQPLAAAGAMPAVIVVMVPELDWGLWDRGAAAAGQGSLPPHGAALVNVRSGGRSAGQYGTAGHALTLSAGRRAEGEAERVGAGGPAQEPLPGGLLAEVYERRTGWTAVGGGALLHPGWAGLRQHQVAGAELGLLGERLARAGIAVTVLGASDLGTERRRFALAAAADARGQVARGAVDLLLHDPTAPYGLRTDWAALAAALAEAVEHDGGLVLVEVGDLYRSERQRADLAPAVINREQERVLGELLPFLAAAVAGLAPGDALYLVGGGFAEGPRLGLLLEFRGGAIPAGGYMLTSATTQRPGLVANYDLTATVLRHFGLATEGVLGRPVTEAGSLAGPAAAAAIWRAGVPADLEPLHEGLLVNEKRRWAAMRSFVYGGMTVLVASLLYLVLPLGPAPRPLRAGVYLVTAFPPAAVMLPYLPGWGEPWYLYLPALVAAFALAARAAGGRPTRTVGILAGLTCAVIVLDLMLGGRGSLLGPMGYSAAAGARYYGLGNELAGALLGAACIAAVAWRDVPAAGSAAEGAGQRLLMAGLAVPLVLVAAAPALGANFGATLALAAAAVVLCLPGAAGTSDRGGGRLTGRRPALTPALLTVPVGMGAAVLALVLMELTAGPRTHIGEAWLSLWRGEWEVLAALVQRKLEMNVRLLRFSPWTHFLAACAAAYALLCLRPMGSLRAALARAPGVRRGLTAALAGAVVALAANDSGVVAAGIGLMAPAAFLLCLLLDAPGSAGGYQAEVRPAAGRPEAHQGRNP